MPVFPHIVLIAVIAQPPPAEPAPSAAELEEIERAVAADKRAGGDAPAAAAPPPAARPASLWASMNPDIAFIADFALAAFSSATPRQTGAHDPRRNGFNLQQLEMSLSKAVDPYFRFDSNIVFGQFGVELEEAYATTLALPWSLQLRAGQFLTRIGRLNALHPHAWDFVDQPFVLGRLLGGEGNRGLGVEGSWLSPLPWYLELVASVTDAVGEGTARSFFGGADLPVHSPLDLQTTVAVKQFFPLSPDLSLSWGLSGAFGPNPTGHRNRTDIYGTDLYLKYRPIAAASHTVIALQAEWFYRRRQVPGDVLADHGGYAQVLWRFAMRWAAAARYEHGSPAHGRAGLFAGDYLDPDWRDDRHRVSAALTFSPSEFSRLRLQGAADAPLWTDEVDWAVFLAAEFVIGAHGSHPF